MYLSIAINLILIIILAVTQLSFISALPGVMNSFNVVLVILLFIVVIGGLKKAMLWGMGVGFILDVYSFNIFGFYLFGICLTIIFAKFLLENFFTNRSLYSFVALTFFSTVFYEIFLSIVLYVSLLLSTKPVFLMFTQAFWINFIGKIMANIALTFLIFYIVNFISDKLKPMFLHRPLK